MRCWFFRVMWNVGGSVRRLYAFMAGSLEFCLRNGLD